MTCTKCGKRLSRKTARMIDGKLLCSPCVFPPMKGAARLSAPDMETQHG